MRTESQLGDLQARSQACTLSLLGTDAIPEIPALSSLNNRLRPGTVIQINCPFFLKFLLARVFYHNNRNEIRMGKLTLCVIIKQRKRTTWQERGKVTRHSRSLLAGITVEGLYTIEKPISGQGYSRTL